MEAKIEPKWDLEAIFVAIEDDGKRVELLREGFEGLELAGPWARARTHLLGDEGGASTKCKFS